MIPDEESIYTSTREKAVADLYGDLHSYAGSSFALDCLLPRFLKHINQLGLPPETILRGKTFLDAGCGGFGGGVAIAARLGASQILGIDLSPENIRSAQERFRTNPNVRFQQENLINLSLPSDSYDFVYCVGVLMCLEQPETAFRQLVRVLRPGGRIYIGVYGSGGLYNEFITPASRLAGKIIPRTITSKILERWFPGFLRPTSSLMDLMYVPIDRHYRVREVLEWFEAADMKATFLRHPDQPRSLINTVLFGEGSMIYFSAVKP
jgi:SAM-dependent methyltransferase